MATKKRKRTKKAKVPKKKDMGFKVLVAGIFLIILILIIFFVLPSPEVPTQKTISDILDMTEEKKVTFEGTVIPIGSYVYTEDGTWAIRTLFEDSDFSLGDRVKVTGTFKKYGGYYPYIDNFSNVELLSRGFPIEPLQVSSITNSSNNRLVKIKNQELEYYEARSLKGTPFWVLEFSTYGVFAPQEYVSSDIVEGNNYDIVGIIECPPEDTCRLWSFGVKPS